MSTNGSPGVTCSCSWQLRSVTDWNPEVCVMSLHAKLGSISQSLDLEFGQGLAEESFACDLSFIFQTRG